MVGTVNCMVMNFPVNPIGRGESDSQPIGNAVGAESANAEIANGHRDAVLRLLNTVLADEFVLHLKSRRFHWNVEGRDFSELHDLFEKHQEQLGGIIDEVAERIRALDGIVAGSLEEYLKLTRLNEDVGRQLVARDMASTLLKNHEALVLYLRADLRECAEQRDDGGTANFLTDLTQAHERMSWMLRAYLR